MPNFLNYIFRNNVQDNNSTPNVPKDAFEEIIEVDPYDATIVTHCIEIEDTETENDTNDNEDVEISSSMMAQMFNNFQQEKKKTDESYNHKVESHELSNKLKSLRNKHVELTYIEPDSLEEQDPHLLDTAQLVLFDDKWSRITKGRKRRLYRINKKAAHKEGRFGEIAAE